MTVKAAATYLAMIVGGFLLSAPAQAATFTPNPPDCEVTEGGTGAPQVTCDQVTITEAPHTNGIGEAYISGNGTDWSYFSNFGNDSEACVSGTCVVPADSVDFGDYITEGCEGVHFLRYRAVNFSGPTQIEGDYYVTEFGEEGVCTYVPTEPEPPTEAESGESYFTAATAEQNLCAARQTDFDTDDDGDFSFFEALVAAFSSLMNYIIDFLWVGCDTFQPLTELVDIMRYRTPFAQLIWTFDAMRNALADDTVSGVITIRMPPPWDCEEGCDLVLFDPEAVYEAFGGEEGWGTYVRTPVAFLSLLGLGFYFYREAKNLLV